MDKKLGNLMSRLEKAVESDSLLEELREEISALDSEHRKTMRQLAIARFGLQHLGEVARGAGDNSFLTEALDRLAEALDADRGALFIQREPATDQFVTIARNGDHPVEFSRTIINRVMSTGTMLTGYHVRSGRLTQSDSIVKLGIKDFLCVPFAHGDEAKGAVYLDRRRSVVPFPKAHVELVRDFCEILGRILRQLALDESERKDSTARRILQALVPEAGGKGTFSNGATPGELPDERRLVDVYRKVLEERGFSNLQIARILGIGESTYYRRWPGSARGNKKKGRKKKTGSQK